MDEYCIKTYSVARVVVYTPSKPVSVENSVFAEVKNFSPIKCRDLSTSTGTYFWSCGGYGVLRMQLILRLHHESVFSHKHFNSMSSHVDPVDPTSVTYRYVLHASRHYCILYHLFDQDMCEISKIFPLYIRNTPNTNNSPRIPLGFGGPPCDLYRIVTSIAATVGL